MTNSLSFEEAVKRIDEIAEGLANGTSKSKGKTTIELRRLCGRHCTVPTSYKLADVVKEGDCAQRNSRVAEIWKGRYRDAVVALKVLRVSQDDPHMQRTKSLFCKEVVLMKQVNHDNILPFYGVSTTVSEFCLVFPWYENGNITDYIKREPNANQLGLLSGAVNGLRFLHESRLVHGSLRPSHILIDDNGVARLATAGHSSIVAVPGTSIAGWHVQSALDGEVDDYRYSAPEIQWPEDYGMDKILITKESDVYGMAMVIYEVLAGEKPYYKDNRSNMLSKVQAGEIPERPSDRINDPAWELLQKCWGKNLSERPPTVTVYKTLSELSSCPQVIHTPQPEGRSVTGELPGKLKLQFQSIKISLDKSKQQQFSVKLKYGSKDYTTALTKPVDDSGEHTWKGPESWSIETDKQHHGQSASLELILRTGIFKKDKVCAIGNFTLLNNVNKQSSVKLEAVDGTGSAVLKILLMEM
ncbi:kinase-like protein [Thelephora ganbajun]|uniref:Kinase-like protein n=1 Tax=Thelephora ganbajun TaxID=370292 RepID=A0ACB6ZLP9_THEGA|nr:kinase-like protein [Thelephora ganbajun]